MSISQQPGNKTMRWPLAIGCSVALNALLLTAVIRHAQPVQADEPLQTLSVYHEPELPEPQPVPAVSGGWKSPLSSRMDETVRAPVSSPELSFNIPSDFEIGATPSVEAFVPNLGNVSVVQSSMASPANLDREAMLQNRMVFDRFYPSSARIRRITGVSIIEFEISASGKITAARLISSEPTGVFDKAALKAAAYARFEPAVKNGKPVAVTKRLRLEWTPPR